MAITAFTIPLACSYLIPVVRAGYTRCYENKYCPDGYYCCHDRCCARAYFWSYWYFWLGLLLLLFAVLSGIITACKRCLAKQRTSSNSPDAHQLTSCPSPPDVSLALPPYSPRCTTTDQHRTPALQAVSSEEHDNTGMLFDEYLADMRPIRPGEKPPPYSLYPTECHEEPTTTPSGQLTSGQNNGGQHT
ncbi:uncharacterized protein LOC144877949 [Branchiostoma floridae x Branchiostoma japonicum]